jgi:hypothetical protein
LRWRWEIDRDDLLAPTVAVGLDLKAIVHPAIVHPAIVHPAIVHPAIVHPAIVHREIVLTDHPLKAIGLSVPQRTNSVSSSGMASRFNPVELQSCLVRSGHFSRGSLLPTPGLSGLNWSCLGL